MIYHSSIFPGRSHTYQSFPLVIILLKSNSNRQPRISDQIRNGTEGKGTEKEKKEGEEKGKGKEKERKGKEGRKGKGRRSGKVRKSEEKSKV